MVEIIASILIGVVILTYIICGIKLYFDNDRRELGQGDIFLFLSSPILIPYISIKALLEVIKNERNRK